MLRWTQAGAVAAPTTVQIRVQQQFSGRIPLGVSAPSRGLSPAELIDNIRWFSAAARDPRSRPCTTLVLTGAGLAARSDVPAAVALGREEGIRRVVLHVELDDLDAAAHAEYGALADALAVRVHPHVDGERALEAIARAAARGQEIRASIVLEQGALDAAAGMSAAVVRAGAGGVQLSYPFPGGPPPPPVPEAVAAAVAVAAVVPPHISLSIKGLPACALPEDVWRRASWRTPNRWYVDAQHQLQQAVLFLPDVVRFAKADRCRFCAADPRCDGYFDGPDHMPGLPPLTPQTEPTTGTAPT